MGGCGETDLRAGGRDQPGTWRGARVRPWLRERVGAGAQGRYEPLAVSGAEPGEHLLLDGAGRLLAGAEHSAAVPGKARWPDAAVARMRTADHQALSSSSRSIWFMVCGVTNARARQVGVGQPGPLIQEGEHAVMGDGGAVLAQGRCDCGMRRGPALSGICFTPSAISGGSGILSV